MRKLFSWRVALAAIAFSQLPAATNPAAGVQPPADINRVNYAQAQPMLENNIARSLRYLPDGTDFVITNGAEFFNRPLYFSNRPGRVDGGDKPEFAFYLPGRGGNLRLGVKTPAGVKWLNDAEQVVARYRPGSMIYEIRDSLLGRGVLRVTALCLADADGLIVRAEIEGAENVALVAAFGGANGDRDRSSVDIGCSSTPVGRWFQLKPEYCRDNKFTIEGPMFSLAAKPGTMDGFFSSGTKISPGDAADWSNPGALVIGTAESATPVAVALSPLSSNTPAYIVVRRPAADGASNRAPNFAALFDAAEKRRAEVAGKIIVDTPDPFINAAASALCAASDAVWDDKVGAWMHGAVAWRVPLLGWRGDYIGDALGWHARARRDFDRWAARQNTNAIPGKIPAPEASANLSRNETALHSNGDLSGTHYDMNLVFMDAFFRHLRWTGDLDYARKMWPVIERHLAWERRLFRREFVSASGEKLPLYEAYCCIWASDDLACNGGGAAHSTACNYFQNAMAARVAKLIGKDASPYEREAQLILRGLKENLWLADRGWFAEWKDYLGLQLVHPSAAVWTFYHTVDSEVPSPLEAWQMSRFVDTQIAHFPLRGSGVPAGNSTIAETGWMPYTWSLNNVVMAETMHTALGYWQAGRADGAFPLFKGALLDSMYCGLCPGNVGCMTWFDANRREAQRDFADGCGMTSRALVEGLFGVKPDLLAGQIKIAPGFPAEWNHAGIKHPDFIFNFQRAGTRDIYTLEQHFAKPVRLVLQVPALRENIAGVQVNGKLASWHSVEDAVGKPLVEIMAEAAEKQVVEIQWSGQPRVEYQNKTPVLAGNERLSVKFDANITAVEDPQHALNNLVKSARGFEGGAAGVPGQRTVFAKLSQGAMSWWQPVTFEISVPADSRPAFDWTRPVAGKFETVDISAQFNDKVTQIFRNEYLSPRSPFCSLAKPEQGFGSWCHPKDTFDVDDSGLRALAAKNSGKIILPDGVPLATPGEPEKKNIAFVSQWDNYPRAISVPLAGKSPHAFLLMAGSTTALQSRFDNGEVIVAYADGSAERLPLENPGNWWPIDQDYLIDDFAFARPGPLPVRVDLQTGEIRVLQMETFKGRGGAVRGGAATVLDLPLDENKELKSLTVRALANEVVIGLMGVTLQRAQ